MYNFEFRSITVCDIPKMTDLLIARQNLEVKLFPFLKNSCLNKKFISNKLKELLITSKAIGTGLLIDEELVGYFKSFEKRKWAGFECSLVDIYNKDLVVMKLEEARKKIESFLFDNNYYMININLLIDLLEHEVQHHGQLIRFAYANKIEFPRSWSDRYTV